MYQDFTYDFAQDCAEDRAQILRMLDEREAARPPSLPVDYGYQPQQQGHVHTPEAGAAVVALIQQAGYPKAVLVGSLSKGQSSKKDIDVLIPLRTKKQKQQCVAAMRALFNPNHMASGRGWDAFGLVAKPHGVIDIFFNNRNK